MSALPDPLVFEFETAEAKASHNVWLRAKIAKNLADSRPSIPHDQVMVKMYLLIGQIEAAHQGP